MNWGLFALVIKKVVSTYSNEVRETSNHVIYFSIQLLVGIIISIGTVIIIKYI